MPTCLLTTSSVGIIAAIGLVVASGVVPLTALKGNAIPGLERWAMIGLIPVAAAFAAWHWDRRGLRHRSMAALACCAVAFLAVLIVFPIRIIDARKAPKELVSAAGLCQPDAEIRIASYAYFQPSLVFYSQREVKQLQNESAALEFLESPMPGYLICPSKSWAELSPKAQGTHTVLARHHDLYRNYEVVVVSNR